VHYSPQCRKFTCSSRIASKIYINDRNCVEVTVSGKAAVAQAAMSAVEPLVELLLELGVTSPEAESLLRGVFVHKTREWLARQSSSTVEPSDVRISLVTGVHRNFVRRILAEPPKIAEARKHKSNHASRLLQAWYTDPAYLDSSGKPRDLPEKGSHPSFQSLSTTYVPSVAPGVVLDQLRRAGLVQMLSEHRLRVRGRTFRAHGFTRNSIADVGHRTRELLETLTHNIHQPDSRRFCETMREIEVELPRIPVIRDLINRRATTFLAGMEHELAVEARRSLGTKRKGRINVGLTIYQTERGPKQS
jgi:hypothetical protein